MVKLKSSRPPEVNELNIPTDGNKGQASNPKKYRGNKHRNKISPETGSETDFQGQCTDFEGYTFDLGTIAPGKLYRTMKELERYLGATYSGSYQPAIMTETAATSPDPDMSTTTDLGTQHPKAD